MKKTSFKENKGITLIALVVTIIVLIILAAVSIAMLTGNSGILSNAKSAKEKTKMEELKETAELVKQAMKVDTIINTQDGVMPKAKLVSEIAKEFGKTTSSISTVTVDGYDIIVDDDLTIRVQKSNESVTSKGVNVATEILDTESRAKILRVYPSIEGTVSINEYTEKKLSEIDNLGDEDKKIERLTSDFIYAVNYESVMDGGAEIKTFSDALNFKFGMTYDTPQKMYQDMDDAFDSCVDMLKFMVEHCDFYYYKWMEEYGADFEITCNGKTVNISKDDLANGDYAEFFIINDETYEVFCSCKFGTARTSVKDVCDIETFTTTAVATTSEVTSKDDKQVTVPAGFYYGNDDSVGKVETGFVITDSVDSNGNSTGSEFVWIPVNKETLCARGTDKPMAELSNGTDYKGKIHIYSFPQGMKTEECREPATLSDYDVDTETYLKEIGLTESGFAEKIQTEYNNMIASIKQYGGFYVSRYEMSMEKGKAVSKLGLMPSTAEDSETKMWYGLYSKAKTYSNASVESGMIWGTQYDAMIQFALNGVDYKKVKDGVGYEWKYRDKNLPTGCSYGKKADKINNIYDLCANVREWTQEACETKYRVSRGFDNFEEHNEARNRNTYLPKASSYALGTRISLYIN